MRKTIVETQIGATLIFGGGLFLLLGDKKQLQEFISAIGSIAETALLFYRSTLAAKATPEEAMRLTQAFIAAIFYGNKNSSSTPEQ